MNKLYMIFGDISGMGGGQMYIRNKVNYLEENNWKVEVYNIGEKDIIIDSLKKYKNNVFPEAGKEFMVFSSKKYLKDLEIFEVKYKNKFDEIIIESDIGQTAVWGEKIAERIGAKHVIFALPDGFGKYRKWYYDFLWFKFQRHELAGISPQSLRELFRTYKDVDVNERFSLKFINNCEFVPYKNENVDRIRKKDVNLCSVARLDKGYIIPMLSAISKLSDRHKDKIFQIILVGDTNNDDLKNEILNYNEKENLEIVIVGFLYPLPSSLLEISDLFIGTAGAILASAVNNKLSICVTTDKGRPVGIIGIDTNNVLETKCLDTSLDNYLEKIIFKSDLQGLVSRISLNGNMNNYMKEYDNHMKFIENSCKQKNYYAFSLPLIKKIFFRIVELVGFQRVRKIKCRLRRTN